MKTDTNDMVSVSDASKKGVSWLVSQAESGRTLLMLRNNRPAAVVASVEALERLEHIDELIEDLQLCAAALARRTPDSGARHDLDDVIAELGIEDD